MLSEPEVSVVIPCLNEADTLELCIRKAQQSFVNASIHGEVLVADNGSIDGSPDIATRLGARVVHVSQKGYGSALHAGIQAARAKFIVMGDADDSYDFLETPKFVAQLRQGFDLVQGCRLPAGGGRVMPGAMPILHRWIGNPMFSFMARHMFSSPIHDIYCGLRGFSKALYQRLELRCTGMEFATEMIIKASLQKAKIAEIPITLHRDGRKSHTPHLKTVRDGWRTLRFFLLLSPEWLFFMPGCALILLGLAGYAIALPGLSIGNVTFDAHTLLFSSLAVLSGYQSVLFAIFAKTFAINEGILAEDAKFREFFRILNLERGLLIGAVALFVGLVLLGEALWQWRMTGFGHLDYSHTMRWVIPGVTLAALGFQTILSSFFVSILGMKRGQ
jgi:glycosyltransferase involved in cell wall biosynthesis